MGPYGARVAFLRRYFLNSIANNLGIRFTIIMYGDPLLCRSNFVRDYCPENYQRVRSDSSSTEEKKEYGNN